MKLSKVTPQSHVILVDILPQHIHKGDRVQELNATVETLVERGYEVSILTPYDIENVRVILSESNVQNVEVCAENGKKVYVSGELLLQGETFKAWTRMRIKGKDVLYVGTNSKILNRLKNKKLSKGYQENNTAKQLRAISKYIN